MLIHEKLMPGQFLLDFKNDRTGLLNPHLHNQRNHTELHPQHQQHPSLTAHFLNHHHHHHLQQQQQQQHQHLHSHHHHQSLQLQQQPTSPPISSLKMDLYTAYAYQQQHQQLINNNNNNNNNKIIEQQQKHTDLKAEALDLSRRCDSVETPRKTPSPTHTSSSTSTTSPAGSPVNTNTQKLPLPQPNIPSNLLYSAEASQQQLTMPPSLATLYPAFYYPSGIIKPEPVSPSSPCTTPPPPPSTMIPSNTKLPIVAASELLQTFATAATVPNNTNTQKQTSSSISIPAECKSPSSNLSMTTPTSPQLNSLASFDAKNTRPFKAFPRDPLVIAANFAANDVLLDNPRVERYTEYRKRVLEQIRNSNGGARTITNPKMRRTNSRNADGEGSNSACRSLSEERHEEINHTSLNNTTADESSDCDSNTGNFEKTITASTDETSNAKSTTLITNSNGSGIKDAAYYERRRKNNAAAKKSRDRRRIKEDEIAIRAAYLERQNIELLCQIDALKAQLATFTSKMNA